MGGPAPIPLNQIESYCNLYKIHDVEKVDELIDWIQFLDNVYLEISAEKSKANK